jgi:4-cresol dehydrogenase (hydroxylating)
VIQVEPLPTRPLPPGVSHDQLARALDAIGESLGAEAVLTSDEALHEFRDPSSFPTWDDYAPSGVVMPSTVEQVQAVVRFANEHQVPLWTQGPG